MLIKLATVPVICGFFYMYIRDKYEREPFSMAVYGFTLGIFATFIIYGFGRILEFIIPHNKSVFFTSFISSSFVEETIKFTFLYRFIWKNENFNEPLDGIVYSVFISLGFAWIENLVYVLHYDLGGVITGFSRAFLSVPSHGLFGVFMGYYFGKAKFDNNKKLLITSFILPYFAHALYNYFLLYSTVFTLTLFFLLQLNLWYFSMTMIKKQLKISPFKKKII